jgi:hypothetical protein
MLRATLVLLRFILKATAHATRREKTMPFTSRTNDRACSRFEMRLTASERVLLREEADLAGMSISELVRMRTFGKTIHAAIDLVMIRELRWLGGLQKYTINKFAPHVAVVDECNATIRALRASMRVTASLRWKAQPQPARKKCFSMCARSGARPRLTLSFRKERKQENWSHSDESLPAW